MSYLLTAPTAALVVSRGDAPAPVVEDRESGRAVSGVYGVESSEEAVATLGGRDDVGVAVVTGDLEESLAAACERLRAADESLPIVAYVDVADGEAVAGATQAGATTVVATGDEEGLATAIENGIERYRRRRNEAAESSMFTTLLGEIGVSIYVKDDDGRHLRMANVPGGPDPKNALGKTDQEIYGDPEGAAETSADDRTVLEEGEAVRNRVEHFETEGSDVWTKTTKVPWRDEDGEVQGLVGLSLNVTDEIQKERRIETFEERFDRFANNLSHDLKSPLQVASGHLELARETGEEAAFEKVATSLERMEEMIDDISLLATTEGDPGFQTFDEHGAVEEITDPAHLQTMLDEIWDVVREEGATLRNRFPGATVVMAQESTVRPLLENLLRNAVQHGGSDVTVEIGPLPDTDGFYVADDGPGIPPEKRDEVFADGYTTRAGGTGTGLSIVAESIEQRDWTIDVTESDAGGARFEIGNCPTVPNPDQGLAPTESVALAGGVTVGEINAPTGEEYDPETDRWTIESGGRNVWRQDNQFRFVHAELEGACRIQGRIPEPAAISEYSKSGFMVRDSLDPDAAYGCIVATPEYGTELLWRSADGRDGTSHQFGERATQFSWYRIDRVEDVVTCYCSTDGETWHPVDQRRVELSEPVYAGMVVCSCVPGSAATATFEDVTVERLGPEE